MMGMGNALLGGMEKLSAKAESIKESTSNLDQPLNSDIEKEAQEQVKHPENRMDKMQELDLPISDDKDMAENANSEMPEKEDMGRNYEGADSSDDAGEFRDLTAQEKAKIKEDLGWSDKRIDSCKMGSDGIKFPCINSDMAGKKNNLGVEYKERIIEKKGYKIVVEVPEFKSEFTLKLPEEIETASYAKHFKECNAQLYEAIQKDPILERKFTKRQIEQIKDGETPEGYTWHHDAQPGVMMLVDERVHEGSRHTGGKAIWGGGREV